uniref:EH domain-containing protein 3-like n=1 Tax=Sinocyclocheilus grahami TaxID=75366 RepID=A0A672PN49_SINGR
MFSWLGTDDRRKKDPEVFQTVSEGLKKLYKTKLLPLEEHYKFHEFHSPALEDADFDNKPMVLLVGQYSTGKTSFIRYLLEQDFPGMRIGPEPTTDSFIAVMHGTMEGLIPGNALVMDPKKPFRKLNAFGNAFLNRFVCAQLPNPVLDGEKQRISRGYDFAAVLEWFAERVDRIILLFDAHKLDISDEFSEVIKAANEQRASEVSLKEIMHYLSALRYRPNFLIRPIPITEKMSRYGPIPIWWPIYRASLFLWNKKYNLGGKQRSFAFVLSQVHAYIISSLKKEMPSVFGKENKKKELVNSLGEIYSRIEREHQISPGDFPNLKKMQEQLQAHDLNKFQPLKMKLLDTVDDMLGHDIAQLMVLVRQEETQRPNQVVKGGAFEGTMNGPFGHGYGEGAGEGIDEVEWVVARDKPMYDEIFYTLSPVNGKVTGANAKKEMVKSKLPNTVLGKIWKLADIDKDGLLDDEEFALANHLIKVKLEGHELPSELPAHLVPPSKRKVPE